MVRVRPMVDDDAKYIVEFNQGTDENFLHQWAGGRFYTYPITSEQIIARIKNTNNTRLAEVARAEALRPFHGLCQTRSQILNRLSICSRNGV